MAMLADMDYLHHCCHIYVAIKCWGAYEPQTTSAHAKENKFESDFNKALRSGAQPRKGVSGLQSWHSCGHGYHL